MRRKWAPAAAGVLVVGVLVVGCGGSGGAGSPSTTTTAPSVTSSAAPATTTPTVVPTTGPDGTFGALVLAAGDFPVPLVAQSTTAAEFRDSLMAGGGNATVDPAECAGASPASPGALADLGFASAMAASTGLTVREVVSTATRSLSDLDGVVSRCAKFSSTRQTVQTTTTITPAAAPAVAADAVRAYTLVVSAEVTGATQQRTQRAVIAQLGPVQVVVTGDNGTIGGDPDAGVVDQVATAAVAKVRGGR